MTYKGVVFNEMKGVYSSPDSANSRITQSALFPDNTYAIDSGGDPTVIPELSYDEFRTFHGRYYHPSNARFWFYGDDPPEERLRILDSYLSEFEAREVDSTVGVQPLFDVSRPWPSRQLIDGFLSRLCQPSVIGETHGSVSSPKK